MQDLFARLVSLFETWGYWTVFFGVMLENTGLPVPGETVLLVASFLAANPPDPEHMILRIQWVIAAAVVGAAIGDNIGYWIGHRGGRAFLERHAKRFLIRQSHLDRAERVFQRYGAATVFFARFITGLRVVAGPFAGVLRLPWRKFLLFNFAGAIAWSTTIGLIGYFFGAEWPLLLKILRRFTLSLVGLFLLVIVYVYWRNRTKGSSAEMKKPQE